MCVHSPLEANCNFVVFRMATHSAAVGKWPHVNYCIASGLNLH
jgi:hypothetical protein